MRKTVAVAGWLALLVMSVVQIAAAQASSEKTVNVAGTWSVTITESSPAHANTVGTEAKERWVIQQNGTKVTAKVTGSAGEAEASADGAMTGVTGDVMKVQATNGDFMVQATLIGDEMVGTMRNYKDKKERIWVAKRTH